MSEAIVVDITRAIEDVTGCHHPKPERRFHKHDEYLSYSLKTPDFRRIMKAFRPRFLELSLANDERRDPGVGLADLRLEVLHPADGLPGGIKDGAPLELREKGEPPGAGRAGGFPPGALNALDFRSGHDDLRRLSLLKLFLLPLTNFSVMFMTRVTPANHGNPPCDINRSTQSGI